MGKHGTYIIAEIGSNSGGSLDAALALIDAAADAGADAAKFQAGHADHVYDPTQFPDEHASFRKYVEPTLGWLPKLAQCCSERGIDFGCSAFCFDALDAVDPYVKWHKVASIEATWTDFVCAVNSKGKPMIVSTGLCDYEDVMGVAVPATVPYVLMQCTTDYPAKIADAGLRAMASMSKVAHGVGLSDHTTHPTIAPCAAVALGACVIEKHIRGYDHVPRSRALIEVTYQPGPVQNMATPDVAHSLAPEQFREMVHAIRLTEKALGSSEKRIRDSERPFLKYRRGKRGLRGA